MARKLTERQQKFIDALLNSDDLVNDDKEVTKNPRSRSAIMRVFKKI